MKNGRLKTNDDYSLQDLFSEQSVLTIPLNQRQYKWSNDQLDAFWDDFKKIIESIDENGNPNYYHYFGIISMINSQDKEFRCGRFKIIDGQQRIITSQLMLAALRDIFVILALESENSNFRDECLSEAKNIHESYLTCKATKAWLPKVVSSKVDRETFDMFVNINTACSTDKRVDIDVTKVQQKDGRLQNLEKIKELEKYHNDRISNAYRFFFKKIKLLIEELAEIEEKKNKLLSLLDCLGNCEIICVNSDDESTLFTFFNSLNTKGLKLSKFDIIRNDLLEIIQQKFPEKLDIVSDSLDELVKNIDGYDEIKFLKYYYICTENKVLSEEGIPNAFKDIFLKLKTHQDVNEKICELQKYSLLFISLFDGSFENIEIQKFVRKINLIGQQACHSFLMDFFVHVEDERNRVRITEIIKKIMYRRSISNLGAKGLDGKFRNLILHRDDYKDLSQMTSYIKSELFVSDEDFLDNINKSKWTNNDIGYVTLWDYESSLNNENESYFVLKSRREVHIEHIVPESFPKEWEDYVYNDDYNFEGDKRDIISSIGNLLLLKSNINTSIQDKPFGVKKNEYKSSNLEQVKEIIEMDYFRLEDIKKREEKLVSAIMKINQI